MRFISRIPYPGCQISLFSFNQKFVIQFEKDLLQQVYKMDEADTSIEKITENLTPAFLNGVMERFAAMEDAFKHFADE